jgi:hypothetical protein
MPVIQIRPDAGKRNERKTTQKNESKKIAPLASLNENDRPCRAIGQTSRDEPPIGARRQGDSAGRTESLTIRHKTKGGA